MRSFRTRMSRRAMIGFLAAGPVAAYLSQACAPTPQAAKPTEAPAANSTEAAKPAAPAAAPAKSVTTLKFAHTAATTHPSHIWATKFGEELEKLTNGAYKVDIYPGAQLGKDAEVAGQVLAGTVEMMNTGNSLYSQWVPAASIMDMPYLFRNLEHMYALQDGPMGQEISKLYQEKGFRVMGWADIGVRHITNNKRPIDKPADLQGLKMRVVPSKTFVETFKALGATAVTMDFSELYSGLQQGVVDGEDNPTTTIQSSNFQEVQRYLSLTGHIVGTNPTVVSEKFFSGLPSDAQQAMATAGAAATKTTREFVKDNEGRALDFLKGKGMVVNTPDQEPFRAATASVYETLKDLAPPDLVAKIRAVA
jgi:TRAP-type transport system periplasmic protein